MILSTFASALRRRAWIPGAVFILAWGGWEAFRHRPAAPGRYRTAARVAVVEDRSGLSAAELGGEPSPFLLSPSVRRYAARLVAAILDRKEPTGEFWRTADDAALQAAAAAVAPDDKRLRAFEDRLAAALEVEKDAIVARGDDPAEAALLANAAARSAQIVTRNEAARAHEKALKRARERVLDLREQMALKELELGDADESVLTQERRRETALAATAEIDREVERVRARADRTRLRILALEAAEHRLREAHPSGPEEDGLTSAVLQRLRQDMDAIYLTIAQEGLAKTPEAPRFKDLMRRLGELDDAYRAELHRERARAIVRLREALEAVDLELAVLDERRLRKAMEIGDTAEEIRRAEPRRAELLQARRDLAAAEELERRLARASEPGFRVAAGEPAPPGKPEPVAPAFVPPMLPGFLGAAGLAVLAAVLAGMIPVRIRTDADVKACLNLPSLGVIPTAIDPNLLRVSPQDSLAELYAMSATLLRSYLADHEFRTCFVTSARDGEGKTTVAVNLAVALARKGVSVALLDCDLRRPRLHEIFNLDPTRGLTTLLRGEETESETVLGTLEIPTLRVMPAGPIGEGAADLLESRQMADLLKVIRERYDVVLLDGPPVGKTSDALTLARLADTGVWVIRAGRSDARKAGWTKHLLKNVGADLAGVLLNGCRRHGGERAYVYRPASGAPL